MTAHSLMTPALTFLQPHLEADDAGLADLLERCVKHLIDTTGASRTTALDTTLQAWGELSARGRREYIDCSRSTSFTLFLVDATGRRHAFTLKDLFDRLDLATRPSYLN